MCQSTSFKVISLPIESVTLMLISDILVLDTGLNKALRGSNVNGYDLVRLSVGIIPSVLPNRPSTMLSMVTSQLILMTSILFVIFGNFELYSVCVIKFFQTQLNPQNLNSSNQVENRC